MHKLHVWFQHWSRNTEYMMCVRAMCQPPRACHVLSDKKKCCKPSNVPRNRRGMFASWACLDKQNTQSEKLWCLPDEEGGRERWRARRGTVQEQDKRDSKRANTREQLENIFRRRWQTLTDACILLVNANPPWERFLTRLRGLLSILEGESIFAFTASETCSRWRASPNRSTLRLWSQCCWSPTSGQNS